MGCLSEALLISLHALAVFKRVFKVSLLVVVIFSKLKVVNLLEIVCFFMHKVEDVAVPQWQCLAQNQSFIFAKIYIYIYIYVIFTKPMSLRAPHC